MAQLNQTHPGQSDMGRERKQLKFVCGQKKKLKLDKDRGNRILNLTGIKK
jgi:hypothetical protein